jgi:rubredoxin
MTTIPETRYRCDRCGFELNVVTDSNAIGLRQPPEGWQVMAVGIQAPPQTHLCPACTTDWAVFMREVTP